MTEQLLSDFEEVITELTLIPSDGGTFEVVVDGELVFSKKELGRHAEYAEVAEKIKSLAQRTLTGA